MDHVLLNGRKSDSGPHASFDAVLVPGGGLLPGGELPAWVKNRFDEAFASSNGTYICPLSAGTPYKTPPLDANGFPVLESVAGADYLRSLGHPADRILIENASYDTIGNAFFARTMHTDPAGFRNLAVITSEFHMPRTEAVFEWVFGIQPLANPYRLTFISVPDVGMAPEVRTARLEKERESLAHLPELVARLQDLPSLHRWLFTEHGAYAAARPKRDFTPQTALLGSY